MQHTAALGSSWLGKDIMGGNCVRVMRIKRSHHIKRETLKPGSFENGMDTPLSKTGMQASFCYVWNSIKQNLNQNSYSYAHIPLYSSELPLWWCLLIGHSLLRTRLILWLRSPGMSMDDGSVARLFDSCFFSSPPREVIRRMARMLSTLLGRGLSIFLMLLSLPHSFLINLRMENGRRRGGRTSCTSCFCCCRCCSSCCCRSNNCCCCCCCSWWESGTERDLCGCGFAVKSLSTSSSSFFSLYTWRIRRSNSSAFLRISLFSSSSSLLFCSCSEILSCKICSRFCNSWRKREKIIKEWCNGNCIIGHVNVSLTSNSQIKVLLMAFIAQKVFPGSWIIQLREMTITIVQC